jgi:hypothetical protein
MRYQNFVTSLGRVAERNRLSEPGGAVFGVTKFSDLSVNTKPPLRPLIPHAP